MSDAEKLSNALYQLFQLDLRIAIAGQMDDHDRGYLAHCINRISVQLHRRSKVAGIIKAVPDSTIRGISRCLI